MSAGKLASMSVPATTKTTVYTTGDCAYAELNLNLVNTAATTVVTKVYVSASASPATTDLVCYDQIIPANGGSLILDIKVSSGEKIVVEPASAGLVARVSGLLHSRIS